GFRCTGGGGASRPQDIELLDVATGSRISITNTPDEGEFEPLVSPAAAIVAYDSGVQDRALVLFDLDAMKTIFSVKVDAGGSAVHLHEGSWSPDGRYLRFRIGGDHGICD
ncbi:MAG TPA: hypothetical protein VNN21_02865, partial [Dehalococcoidia bacterium]|nr:hypothetical protein [Dehalococcoidia bacterium]